MTKTKFSAWVGTSLLVSSLLLLPGATPFAQTTTPTPDTRPPETRQVDTRADHDRTSLWGLLGLVGLFGLAGLGRRSEPDRVGTYTNPHERSRT
jgi:MYXO-CTERM domain-containing protein